MLLEPTSGYAREVPCNDAFVRDGVAEFRRARHNLGRERVVWRASTVPTSQPPDTDQAAKTCDEELKKERERSVKMTTCAALNPLHAKCGLPETDEMCLGCNFKASHPCMLKTRVKLICMHRDCSHQHHCCLSLFCFLEVRSSLLPPKSAFLQAGPKLSLP